MRTGTQLTCGTPSLFPEASQGLQVTQVPFWTLPGQGPFPVPSPPLAPPRAASCAVAAAPGSARAGGGGSGALRRPLVPVAAATAPLTSTAEQGARRSQGRSHAGADREHCRDRGRRPGVLPRWHAQLGPHCARPPSAQGPAAPRALSHVRPPSGPRRRARSFAAGPGGAGPGEATPLAGSPPRPAPPPG